jgi:dGTP triphosphohydrolase
MSDSESDGPKVTKKEKKKCSEAQLANLRKGMEAMKQKREALAKQRIELDEKKKKGEVPEDTPLPKYVPKPKVVVAKTVKPERVEMAERPVIVRERKPRVKQVTATDLEAMKTSILTALAPKEVEKTVVKEVPVEKVVEKVVQKERVVTGSELLNKVFGF